MRSRSVLCFLVIGFLVMGILMSEVEARRKILRGRKTITRRYYTGSFLPAWAISVITGILMLLAGGGLYFILKKWLLDSIEVNDRPSYQPAMQDDM
ncbi:uncharacterized protein LOC106643883 [Copidosoma floridanum]|uniref:uncharacterized protein LOC106643883 n=1 Tax=Copidosoma floridanum TaxID=29053 RepID=UPI0006C9B1B0|nr:uncharacterized protein LOC106643883 [Copidosoma floridanum]